MKHRILLKLLLLCLGAVCLGVLVQGCGGGGVAPSQVIPNQQLAAPRLTSAVISRFLKGASDTADWDELKLAVTVEDPNSPPTGPDGKPKPKAKHVRFCLKYDPQENDPLTGSEAHGYLADLGGSTPPEIYVFEVDFTLNPQQVVIPQFDGAAFERDQRYWISAMLTASNGSGGPQSPACEPQRFKMLPGLPFAPGIMVEKKFWGDVTGPDGAPLAGVEVKYVHQGTPVEADVTGADGSYEFFIQVANPHGASALRQVSRGEVTGPTDYELRAQQLDAPGLEALEYLDPEYKDYNVDFTLTTPPEAALAADRAIGRVDLAVSFDASDSSDADGWVVGYDWDWDGDGVYDLLSGGATPQHTYFTPGTYNATVRVVDNAGCTDTASVSITVLDADNDAPVAVLAADPLSGDAPLPVSFDAGDSTDDWEIAGYEFDFGEGAGWEDNGASATASHTYATPGTYTAQVRVTDNEGAQDTASVEVTVNSSAEWHTYSLNPPSTTVKTCCAFDGTGKPYILYVPCNPGNDATYRLWEWNGASWNTSVVGGWGDTGTDGCASLAVKPDGELGVIYSNKGWNGGFGTYFAQRPAGQSSWSRSLIDGGDPSGYQADLKQRNGNYYFTYSPRNTAVLKYGHGQPPAFSIENIETMATTFFRGRIAVDSNGHPYIVIGYYNSNNLKLWYNTAGTWISCMVSTSAAYDCASICQKAGSQMAIAFYSGANLVLATGSESTWSIETIRAGVAPAVPSGYDIQVACDSQGYPHIAYRNDATGCGVAYSKQDSQGWHHEELFASGVQAMRSVSLALDGNDLPLVAYRTGTGINPIEVKWMY